ncbi:hypothetical protein [Edaphobacter dinghuensis]|uniref:Uncharacterized protein n=1 Tax=Edaphobacter dinghuensis TaxID=1560005 RepID=A0A917LYT7_9BACT|nr:hypothetical protein [Edaphobacter dinghuensis]GGG66032.1 hypothetical protein GCM10011585_04800 [Edaphobacter dinghuensis]
MPEYAKDVMLALLGASVGLAGLLLVVAGFVFAQAGSFPPETTDDETIERYELAGKIGLVPFGLSLAEAGLCLIWLLQPSPSVYTTAVTWFFVLLVLTALYGFVLLLRYL